MVRHLPAKLPTEVLDTFLRDAIKTRDIITFDLEDGNSTDGVVIDFDDAWVCVEVRTEERMDGFVTILNLNYVTQITS